MSLKVNNELNNNDITFSYKKIPVTTNRFLQTEKLVTVSKVKILKQVFQRTSTQR